MEAVVAACNQEKAIVGAFSVIVKPQTSRRFVSSSTVLGWAGVERRLSRDLHHGIKTDFSGANGAFYETILLLKETFRYKEQ